MDFHPHVSSHHVPFFPSVSVLDVGICAFIKNQKAALHSHPRASSVPCFNCINIICMSWVSDPYWWRPNRLPMSCSICNHLKFQTVWHRKRAVEACHRAPPWFLSFFLFSLFLPHKVRPFPFLHVARVP